MRRKNLKQLVMATAIAAGLLADAAIVAHATPITPCQTLGAACDFDVLGLPGASITITGGSVPGVTGVVAPGDPLELGADVSSAITTFEAAQVGSEKAAIGTSASNQTYNITGAGNINSEYAGLTLGINSVLNICATGETNSVIRSHGKRQPWQRRQDQRMRRHGARGFGNSFNDDDRLVTYRRPA